MKAISFLFVFCFRFFDWHVNTCFAMEGFFIYAAVGKTTRNIFRSAGALEVLSKSLPASAILAVSWNWPFNWPLTLVDFDLRDQTPL